MLPVPSRRNATAHDHAPVTAAFVRAVLGRHRSDDEEDGSEHGDEAAFEAFVAARSDELLRTAVLLTRDRGHAEDLLQTARGTAYRRWSRIDGEAPRPHVRRVPTAPLDGVTLRLVDASGALGAEGPLTEPVR